VPHLHAHPAALLRGRVPGSTSKRRTRATRLSDGGRVSRADRSYPRCTPASLGQSATRRATDV
jgi:hypothetical protein